MIVAVANSIEMCLAIGCGIYAISLIVVYAISTLSHAIQQPRQKQLLRAWDQGVIYFGAKYIPDPHWTFSVQFKQYLDHFYDAQYGRDGMVSFQIRHRF